MRFDDSAEDIGIVSRDHELWNIMKTAERVLDTFLVMQPGATVILKAEEPIGFDADRLSATDFGLITLFKVPTENHKCSNIYPLLDEGDLPDVVGLCSLDLAIAVSVHL